jgi:hypothetical protein
MMGFCSVFVRVIEKRVFFWKCFWCRKMAINRDEIRVNREKTGKQRKVKIWDFL